MAWFNQVALTEVFRGMKTNVPCACQHSSRRRGSSPAFVSCRIATAMGRESRARRGAYDNAGPEARRDALFQDRVTTLLRERRGGAADVPWKSEKPLISQRLFIKIIP